MIVSMLPSATNRKWLSFVFEPLICASICTGTNTVIDRLKVYIYRCTPMNLASCTSVHKHNLNQVFLSEKAPLLHGLFQLTSRSSCCFYFPLYYYLFLPFFLFLVHFHFVIFETIRIVITNFMNHRAIIPFIQFCHLMQWVWYKVKLN